MRAEQVEAGEKRPVKGYQLIERLGQGGFGVVYRAKQLSVGREVAIKSVLPVHSNTRAFIQRFENEAHLVARMDILTLFRSSIIGETLMGRTSSCAICVAEAFGT